jgi:FKBP-type peptidyl-prolyl cis-trans isomerase
MIHRLTAFALCALCACAQFGTQQRPVVTPRTTVWTASGLECEDVFLGHGASAAPGDLVTIDYTVWLENGDRVDSTLDRGVPLTVALGEAPLRGLNEGVLGMKAGGRRRLTVPPSLAYGEEGVPGLVPPEATLLFEVHLIEIGVR